MEQTTTNLGELRAALAKAPNLPLNFFSESSVIKRGYHVTEIKHASVRSLDCGKGTDQWDELIIQVLNGSNHPTSQWMSAQKFLDILDKSIETLNVADDTRVHVEYSHQNQTMQKLNIEEVLHGTSTTSIKLGGERAVCKPFQRAKAAQDVSTTKASCC